MKNNFHFQLDTLHEDGIKFITTDCEIAGINQTITGNSKDVTFMTAMCKDETTLSEFAKIHEAWDLLTEVLEEEKFVDENDAEVFITLTVDNTTLFQKVRELFEGTSKVKVDK